MFQQTVSNNIGFGVPGELYLEGPLRAQPGVLNSATPANNVIARAFTLVSDGSASFDTSADPRPMNMQAGGTGVFAGILSNPKVYANIGTAAGGTLASTLTLPNGEIAEFTLESAGLIVEIETTGFKIGDHVFFSQLTGRLIALDPSATITAGATRVPGSRIVYFNSASPGLAVISFNSDIDAPAPVTP